MYNITLAGVLRISSILLISLIAFFYIILNISIANIDSVVNDVKFGKDYEYITGPTSMIVPEFTSTLESLFLKESVPVIVETVIVTEPTAPVNIPSLEFVGMIETVKKIIYSFRNTDTNRLLLIEEGASVDGLTLVSVKRSDGGTEYTFKKDNIKFLVDKK